MDKKELKKLETTVINQIIKSAWQDRISFEEIEEKFGLKEADVITVMRRELKASSFKLWRKRVTGRKSKHKKLSQYYGLSET